MLVYTCLFFCEIIPDATNPVVVGLVVVVRVAVREVHVPAVVAVVLRGTPVVVGVERFNCCYWLTLLAMRVQY